MLKVTVDGIQVEVKSGATILDAAKKAGVHIPTFCHDDRIDPTGACRICLVEVEGGPPRLYASCVTPATDEMVVKTNSEKISGARKTNMELLLVHHPLDCPVCPAAGNCGLQDLAYEFGVNESRFEAERKSKPADRSNPCIEQNDNRCVLCSKCVRICDEVQGVNAIGLVRRGFDTYVDTPFNKKLDCDFCGHCVTTCPVGARNSQFLMQGRAWNVRSLKSVCSFCGTGCTIQYRVREKDNKVVQAEAVEGCGINGSFQCSKGWQGFQYVHNADRLGKPLVRSGEKLLPASWDNALDEISSNLKNIIEKHGPGAVAGIGSERLTNEENYLFQKFFRTVVGSGKIDNLLNMKSRVVGEEFRDTLGDCVHIAPLSLLEEGPLVFLIGGADATQESPVVGNMIRRAVTKLKAELIVADSRNIKIKDIASLSLIHQAKTEAALINGIINEILTKNLIPTETASARIENLDELKRAVSEYTLDHAAKIAGVEPSSMARAAEMIAASQGTAFICGREISEHPTSNSALEALRNLILLTGNADGEKGGLMLFREFSNSQGVNDMGVTPNHLPGYQSVQDSEVRKKFEKSWGQPLPEVGEDKRNIIEEAIEGKIKALYIMGEDLMTRYPDGQKVREALGKVDFIIYQDIFLTGTALCANVVLPGVSFAEKTGTFTNMEGRVQRLVQQINPVDESLQDHHILIKIAERMGSDLGPGHPDKIMYEAAQLLPLYNGISTITGKGISSRVNYADPGAKLPAKARTVPFAPPNHSTDEYPYALVTGNLLHNLGPFSEKSEALMAVCPGNFVEINPGDREKLGVADGDTLLVESSCGKLKLPARANARSPQGVVFIPNYFEGVPVNMLISEKDEVTRVRLSKADG